MKRLVIIVSIFLYTNSLKGARFLFDYTKNETAGNADWIIDRDYPYPDPANPTSPTDWDGAISSFGYALYTRGHEVVTLPPDSSITYGSSSPLDLSNFDVFVMVEPQNPLSSSEIQAIIDFVSNGGGFLMVADHNASDRDNDGWDSPHVFNSAFENVFGVHFNVTGDDNNNFSQVITNVNTDSNDPIIYGDVGTVDTFGYWAGTVITLNTNINPELQGHIWENNEPIGSNYNVIVFTGTYGQGKIGGFGDSSPVDDGTGDPSDDLYDGWYTYDDSTLILNLSLWLLDSNSSGGNNNPPVISGLTHIPSYPTDTDSVVVQAIITDDYGLLTDSLYLSVNGGTYTASYHINQIGDTFYYNIGKYPQGDNISYYVIAKDDSGAITYSDTLSYTVQSPSSGLNAGIIINEIMYNPSTAWGNDSFFEYVEIWNATPDTVDMSGWYLKDNTLNKVAHVPDNTLVPPYHFVVFARNVDSLLSKSEYTPYLTDGDEILINIVDSVQLSNSGEWIILVDNNEQTVDSVYYDDGGDWPSSPDGDGPSLELKDPNSDNNDPFNWAASGTTYKSADYGTPGDTNSVFVVTNIKEHSYEESKTSQKVIILPLNEFRTRYVLSNKYEIYDIKGQKISKTIHLKKGAYFVFPKNRKDQPTRFLIIQ